MNISIVCDFNSHFAVVDTILNEEIADVILRSCKLIGWRLGISRRCHASLKKDWKEFHKCDIILRT